MRMFDVAALTVRHGLITRLVPGLALFCLIFFLGAAVTLTASAQNPTEELVRIGLFAAAGVGDLLAIVLAVTFVGVDLESQQALPLLAAPVSRADYLAGRWLGVSLLLAGFGAIMITPLQFAVWLAGAPGQRPWLGGQWLLLALALSVTAAVAVAFAAYTTRLLAGLYTLGVAFAFHAAAQMRIGALSGRLAHTSAELAWLVRRVAGLLPDLGVFDMTTELIHGAAAGPMRYFWAAAYWLFLVTMILIFGHLQFARRDLS